MARNGVRHRGLLGSRFAAARTSARTTTGATTDFGDGSSASGSRRGLRRTSHHVEWILPLCLLFSLTGCHLLQRKNEETIQVASQRNTPKATRLTYLGIHSLHKGHVALAAKRFREAVAADYAYGPAHNNLGLLHYEQGNLYQAVIAFEQAREYLPGDPSAVYNLALALEAAGRTDEALELYYEASAMDPTEPLFLGNLVRIRLRLGENDELLQQQLRDLVLIERRPAWRRWADTQLALTVNDALDRGPSTPDLEASLTQGDSEQRETDVRDKIIDLTPVSQVSHEEEQAEESKEKPTEPSGSEVSQPEVETLPDEPPNAIREELGRDLEATQTEIEEGAAKPLPEPTSGVLPPPTTPLLHRPDHLLRESTVEELSEADYYRK